MVTLINASQLSQSRIQLHYAIQLIAVAGSALLPSRSDDSHSSLSWNPELSLFVGQMIPAAKPFQVAIDPVQLIALVLDQHQVTIAQLPLHQKTLAAGLTWLKQTVEQLGADAEKIMPPAYSSDFPDHPIAHGAPFDHSQAASRQQLADYYAETHELLQEIVTITEAASPIRIWPHHFDIATLIKVPSSQTDQSFSIGVGLSPGDTSYSAPYWYVSPYPYPAIDRLPPLKGHGFWHTSHWVGAVLVAAQVSQNLLDSSRKEEIRLFLHTAIHASRALLQSADA